MKVLMITGDKKFGPSNPRFELQKSAVEVFEVVYWGRGSLLPVIPKGNFDVVTTQDPFWRGLVGMWVACRKHALLNVQVHADLLAQSWLKRLLAQVVLQHASSVRVVSEKIKRQVEGIGTQASVAVLPVFIDIERFCAAKPQPHVPKTILWVGRFEDEKDPLCALAVLREVLKSGINAKLVMVGAGSLEKELKLQARGLPVECAGWQSDIVPSLENADVVLCTSRFESWGASIVEALASRVPVVAPDVGVAREAGALVVPRGELAAKVIEVLGSGVRGELLLQLPTATRWAKDWRESLEAGRVKP